MGRTPYGAGPERTGCGRKFPHARMHAPTLTRLTPRLRTRAAHRSCLPVCAAEARATARDALELSACIRLCAADGGADRRVQAQERRARPALVAGAAGAAQAVNFMAEEQCCRWLLGGALRLCGAAAHALQQSLIVRAGPTRPSQAGRAVPAACARVCEVVW